MAINNFNIAWSNLSARPLKADAPLLIDPNGKLPHPITPERLKPIARQSPQSLQRRSRVQDGQSSFSLLHKPLERPDGLPLSKPFRSLVPVAQDHPNNK